MHRTLITARSLVARRSVRTVAFRQWPVESRAWEFEPRRWLSAAPTPETKPSTQCYTSSAASAGGVGTANGIAATHSTVASPATPPPRRVAPIPAGLASPFPPLSEMPLALLRGLRSLVTGTAYYSGVALRWIVDALWMLLTNPAAARQKMGHLWTEIKHEAHHYWLGSKLFVAETRTSATLLRSVGRGKVLTRRERMQLKRTMGDLLRIVPFIVIVIVPFAEFSLPVLLKLFPNMLPSQFEKAEYRQEVYRKSLNVKLELHGILQEVLHDRVARAADARDTPSAEVLLAQLADVRAGKPLPADAVVSVARLFSDDITLDNMPRGQLAVLAKYMGLSPYTPETVLRYQLRSRLRGIKEDDKDIAREGTAELSVDELRAACEARGMRALDIPKDALRAQLDEWLHLRIDKEVPVTLMMLSRGFQIAATPGSEPAVDAIQESISSLDTHTVAEVVLSAAATGTAATAGASGLPTERTSGGTAAAAAAAAKTEVLEMKLESVEYQNELIAAEREAAASDAESHAAIAAANASAAALSAARTDTALKAGDVAALEAKAGEAAAQAAVKRDLAAAKAQVVFRMRSTDAGTETSAARSSSRQMRRDVDAAAAAAAAAASVVTPAPASPSKQAAQAEAAHILKQEDVQALRSVAAGATTARERVFLDRLRAFQKKIEAAEMQQHRGRIAGAAADVPTAAGAAAASASHAAASAAPITAVGASAPAAAAPAHAAAASHADDRSTQLLKATLQSMMGSMEADLEKINKTINLGATLAAADVDRDGSLDVVELRAALNRILGSSHADEAASALLRRLDRDKDGEVTVASLEAFLDKYADRVARAEARRAEGEAALSSLSLESPLRSDEGSGSDSDSEQQKGEAKTRTAPPAAAASAPAAAPPGVAAKMVN